MPVSLSCPACSKRLHVKKEMAGKRIKCPACAKVFEVPAQPNRPEGKVSKAAPPRPEKRVLWPWVISGVSALLLVVVSAMWLMSGGNTRGRTGEQGADGELATKADLAKVKAEAERTNSELVGTNADLAKVKAEAERTNSELVGTNADFAKVKAEQLAAEKKKEEERIKTDKPTEPYYTVEKTGNGTFVVIHHTDGKTFRLMVGASGFGGMTVFDENGKNRGFAIWDNGEIKSVKYGDKELPQKPPKK
jgi:hypothetical protein